MAAQPVAATNKTYTLVAQPNGHQMSILRAIAVFLCGFLSIKLCRAQIINAGTCPNVQVKENFDPVRYLGRWYESEAYFFLFEFGGKCVTADYSDKQNGVVGVLNKNINIITGQPTQIQGKATLVSRSDVAKLAVSFPSLPVNIEAPYWVLETDYDNYSVVWSCYQIGPFHADNAWILTRKRKPSVEIMQKAYSVLDKNKISRAYLLKTNQNDCPKE